MIWMVVEADVIGFVTSEQRTTVPFKSIPTESIVNLVIRGESSLSRNSHEGEYSGIQGSVSCLKHISRVDYVTIDDIH